MRKEIILSITKNNEKFEFENSDPTFPNIRYLTSISRELNNIISKKNEEIKNKNSNKRSELFSSIIIFMIVISFFWLMTLALRILFLYPIIPINFLVLLIPDASIGGIIFIISLYLFINDGESSPDNKKNKEDKNLGEVHLKLVESHLSKNYSIFMEIFN